MAKVEFRSFYVTGLGVSAYVLRCRQASERPENETLQPRLNVNMLCKGRPGTLTSCSFSRLSSLSPRSLD